MPSKDNLYDLFITRRVEGLGMPILNPEKTRTGVEKSSHFLELAITFFFLFFFEGRRAIKSLFKKLDTLMPEILSFSPKNSS